MVGIRTFAPVSRTRHPATLARSRATDTVNPVIRGARQDVSDEADAALELPVSDSGRTAVTISPANHHLCERLTGPP
jgi:hypothetical protein